MADAHIEIEIGKLKFVAEGSEAWVNEKYEAFLGRTSELQQLAPRPSSAIEAGEGDENTDVGPLAIFLKQKNVGSNQNNRFLAAAIWLKKKGQTTIKTSDVVKALADAQQQRLGNPADVLNQNVKKGFCERTADGFYVTPEGELSLK